MDIAKRIKIVFQTDTNDENLRPSLGEYPYHLGCAYAKIHINGEVKIRLTRPSADLALVLQSNNPKINAVFLLPATTTEITPHHRPNPGGSDKSFGLTIAAAAVIFALYPLLYQEAVRIYLLALAIPFAVLAFISPKTLAPLNALWMKLGELLSRIVSPIALGILFFSVLTPTGILMKLLGKDPLKLKLERDATSYWIKRTESSAAPDSFDNQF